MKRTLGLVLLVAISMGSSGCGKAPVGKDGPAPEAHTKSPAEVQAEMDTVLKTDKFTLAPGTSIIYAIARKDGKVPVTGSLNLTAGSLDFAAGAKPAATLTVDLESYDSGLPLRNERVRHLFFNSDQPDLAKATFSSDGIAVEDVQKLRAEQKLAGVAVSGTLSFHGESHKMQTTLDIAYTGDARLSVKTSTPIAFKISDWQLADNLKAMMMACGHLSVDDIVSLDITAEFSPGSESSLY